MIVNASGLLDFIAIGPYNTKPDLLLITMVFFALNCEPGYGIISSFIIGTAADISAPAMAIGPHIISFVILGAAVSFLQRQVIMSRFFFQTAVIFVVSFSAGIITQGLVFIKLSGYTANSTTAVAMVSVYSALAGPIIWKLLTMIFKLIVIDQSLFARTRD